MADPTAVPLYLPTPTGAGPWALEFTNGQWALVPLAQATVSVATTQQVPQIKQGIVDLGPVWKRGGKTVLEASFTQSQVGKPVIMSHAHDLPGPTGVRPGPLTPLDELENAQADFSGCVVSPTQMLVRWNSSAPMRGLVRVNYLIGS